MVRSLLRLATSSLAYLAVSEIAARGIVSRQRFRGWLTGLVFVLISAALAIFGLIVLIVSLFFKLADLSALVMPAVITSGVSLLGAALAFMQGLNRLRYPE